MTWLTRGWQVFEPEPSVLDWVASVRGPALAAAADPAQQNAWLRHGGTWFVGVDALANDDRGRVGNGPPLDGAAYRAAVAATEIRPLHRAQISVTYPGYPGRDPGESGANHRFRRDRDGAHLDGLLPLGPKRRRYLREPHAWILGIALTEAPANAAPLVVWEGSHAVLRAAFQRAFAGAAPDIWANIDVTEAYQTARAEVFAQCRRVEVPLAPGAAVLVHRLALHGVAPWRAGAGATEARAIAYFRPCFPSMDAWLHAP